MLILLASAALFLAQAAAPAEAEAAKPAPAAEKPEKPKLICRTERAMGSVIPTRVCRTPEQERAAIEAARREMQRASDQAAICSGRSC